jgi:LacI family transcriptional regulator
VAVTIKDIAKAAKVSKAAVSYVINDKPGVSDETRERILKIMKDLNFRPNAAARGLAGLSTETLGLVIPDITDMFYASIVRGVENAANKLGYTLNLSTTHALPERERKAVEAFTSGRVDGVVLMTYFLDEQFLKELKTGRIPFVTIDNPFLNAAFYSVTVDNEEAGYQATKFLTGLGHRRIAYLNGKSGSNDNALRLAGYKRALIEAGIPFRAGMTKNGEFERAKGYEATIKLLQMGEPPTAIFAANDQMALGALGAALEHGLEVPRDLSIIGVDDIEAAALVDPPLTTIKQPTYEMGETAVKLLMGILKGEEQAERKVLLRTQLVERRSCAPPKA